MITSASQNRKSQELPCADDPFLCRIGTSHRRGVPCPNSIKRLMPWKKGQVAYRSAAGLSSLIYFLQGFVYGVSMPPTQAGSYKRTASQRQEQSYGSTNRVTRTADAAP